MVISSKFFSHSHARENAAIPKTREILSAASSRSISSSSGSTIMVDWLFVYSKSPRSDILCLIFLTSLSSKLERLSPLSASSPFFTSIISFITIFRFYFNGWVLTSSSIEDASKSTSSFVLYLEKLTLMLLSIISFGRPIAVSTWLFLPLAQAEPLLT